MTDSGPFDGRTILVSGAGSGIGRAIAIELAQQGAALVLCGRTAEKLEQTRQALPAGSRSTLLPLDLAQLGGIIPAVTGLIPSIGRLYGLVHSAGIVQTLPLAASTPERMHAMMQINFNAGLELCRALARREVLAEGGGSVLWIASVYAHTGAPGQTGYSASKGAITAAVRSLALELAPRAVRVNAVSPGFVRTPMTEGPGSRLSAGQWAQIEAMHPLGAGQPEDVARAAAFLLNPRSRWITGSDLIIDGGYTLRADAGGTTMRFLMVDRILTLEPGKSAVAEKSLSASEELFRDHFPGFPVVPGVLLTEMMAQTAGKALNAERLPRGNAMLIEVRQARFRNWARPDEVIRLSATIEQNQPLVATARCTAEVAGRQVCSAQLLFAFKPIAEFSPDYRDEVLERFLEQVK